jgi:hypothetical protein
MQRRGSIHGQEDQDSTTLGMQDRSMVVAYYPTHGAYTFSERTTTVSTLPVLMRRILNFSTYELVLFLTSQLLANY